ncbi:hypothetical protein BJ508DRAFT_328269 [Ascobolus immersus RN42]|uniref:Fibroin-3 related protein n=1 Tax=Ascobolus immersus RN42 TaxID=1160509 RepID=A0A3N4I4C3_ASCIM|nr:hypothetical protein BJ508DRAFT_328269 [Ascobolus immersus RN42]
MHSTLAKAMLLSRQLPAEIPANLPADIPAGLIPTGVDPATATQVAQDIAAGQSTIAAAQETAMSVAQTFSSFDNCMLKNYCKIPFIVGVSVGGILLFSLLWCCFRCLCCGARCCCCGGGGRKKEKTTEIIKEQPIIYQQPTPASAFPPTFRDQSGLPSHGAGPQVNGQSAPQYATFEGETKHENALPAMPQWDQAKQERIVEEVELSPVDNSQLKSNAGPMGMGGNGAPGGFSNTGMAGGMVAGGFAGPDRRGQPSRGAGGYSPLGSRGGSPDPFNNGGQGQGFDNMGPNNMAGMPPNGGFRGTPGPRRDQMGGPPMGPNGPMQRGPNGPGGFNNNNMGGPGGFGPNGPGIMNGGYNQGQQGINRQPSFPNQGPPQRQNTGGMGGPMMGVPRQGTFNNQQGPNMGPGGMGMGPRGPPQRQNTGGMNGPNNMGPQGMGMGMGPRGPPQRQNTGNMNMGPNANQRMEFQNDGYGPQDQYAPNDQYDNGPQRQMSPAQYGPPQNSIMNPPNRQMSPQHSGPYGAPQNQQRRYSGYNQAAAPPPQSSYGGSSQDTGYDDIIDYPADPSYGPPPALQSGPARQITPQQANVPYPVPQQARQITPQPSGGWAAPQSAVVQEMPADTSVGRRTPPEEPKEFTAYSPTREEGPAGAGSSGLPAALQVGPRKVEEWEIGLR